MSVISSLSYLQRLNSVLRPSPSLGLTVVDLFSGCGGLSLGFEAAGFFTQGVDASEDAVATANANLVGPSTNIWLDTSFCCPRAPVIIGGPPCQPFSEVGLRLGAGDKRDGLPAFIHAVEQARPKVWLFENVPGLQKQSDYFQQILRSLSRLGYKIDSKVLDASNFGVPQRRRRLFVVGWQKGSFIWPEHDHQSSNVGDAIGRLMTRASPSSRFLTPSMQAYVARYEKASKCITPRDLYPDRPSRTVTCRNLAGATGDMLRVVLPDGRRRMLSIREAARLQSFPDWYRFKGSEQSQFNQIGNAVPPLMALSLAKAVRDLLETTPTGR